MEGSQVNFFVYDFLGLFQSRGAGELFFVHQGYKNSPKNSPEKCSKMAKHSNRGEPGEQNTFFFCTSIEN